MEQMEATEITRDMEGKIIPNSENDASIVSVQEEKEIFSEDESELIDKDEAQRDYVKSKEAPKVDNSKDPSLEDKKTAQKQKPLKFLSSFYSDGEGDDF